VIAQLDREYLRLAPGKACGRVVAWALFEGRPLTTRGRWINPLVFALAGLARRAPALARVERPLFVIGTGRSGTTWLGLLLSLHPDVGFLNEPKALWHSARADEDLIGSYARGPARVALGSADATDAARRALAHGYGAYLRLTGARRVLDKYPELVHRVAFARALFPDARFLFLVRDGRATARSIAQWSATHGRPGAEDWWGRADRKWRVLCSELVPREPDLAPRAAALLALERPAERAALEWVLAMRAGLRAEREHAGAVLRVGYEELCRDPGSTLERVLAHCGLAPSDRVLEYARRTAVPAAAEISSESLALPPDLARAFEALQRDLGYG